MTRKELYDYLNAKTEEKRRLRLLNEAIQAASSVAGTNLSGMPIDHNTDRSDRLCIEIERIDFLRTRYNEAVRATNAAERRLDSVRLRLVTRLQKMIFDELYYCGLTVGDVAIKYSYTVGRVYQIRSEIEAIALSVVN